MLLLNGEEPSGHGFRVCEEERGERIRKISSQGKFSGSAKATFRALRESKNSAILEMPVPASSAEALCIIPSTTVGVKRQLLVIFYI